LFIPQKRLLQHYSDTFRTGHHGRPQSRFRTRTLMSTLFSSCKEPYQKLRNSKPTGFKQIHLPSTSHHNSHQLLNLFPQGISHQSILTTPTILKINLQLKPIMSSLSFQNSCQQSELQKTQK